MRKQQTRGLGWFVTFAVIFVVTFVAIYALTGHDALGATVRFAWNAIVVAFEGLMSAASSMLQLAARGLGWGRLQRLSRAVAGIGLGYAASVIFRDKGVRRARGWRHKVIEATHAVGGWWHRLPFIVKLVLVIALICSQIYLNWLLIIFPIAFLVPVVQKLWGQAANVAFSGWYKKKFGRQHRAIVAALRSWPVSRSVIGGARLLRIRYLCAWRLWRYHPRYQSAKTYRRHLSLLEPLRLWRSGELDAYVGRPLLAGSRSKTAPPAEGATHAAANGGHSRTSAARPRKHESAAQREVESRSEQHSTRD